MRRMKKYYLFLTVLFSLFTCVSVLAQTAVKGRITDAKTKEPLPFANIIFTATTVGTTSDFEGHYQLSGDDTHKSITVSYMGYKKQTVAIRPGQMQVINIQLEEDAENLREVVITPGKKKFLNPAYPIIEKALDNKSRNNKNSLNAYEYEAYSKVELSLQRLPEEATKRKIMQQVQTVYDSIHRYTSDEGESLMPIFLSESISRYYYRTKPQLKREHIMHTNLRGFGVEDGSFISQLVGTSFQEYNFYENWLTILEKEFVSPLADGWKLYYEYELQDSLQVDGELCYKIGVAPRRAQDLAFYGTIWITKKDWALKQLDLQVRPEANLNFVHKITISQQLVPTAAGPWLPAKTRVMMDVRRPGTKGSGIVAKLYSSFKDPLVDQPHDPKFYEQALTVEAKAAQTPKDFWNSHRHDSLSYEEQKVAFMIDSANQLPAVRRTIGFIKALGSGHIKLSQSLELGPFPVFYTYNELEKHRIGLGFRTTTHFSPKYRLSAFGAYGTGDNRFKYNFRAEQILSRKNWTLLTLQHSNDLQQVGMDPDGFYDSNQLFYASSRWGRMIMPYRYQQSIASLQTDLARGVTARLSLNHQYFDADYPFAYRSGDQPASFHSKFSTAEVMLETRLSRRESYLLADFMRVSSGTNNWPVLTLRYAYGVPELLSSDFEYHRIGLQVTQLVKMAFLGVSRYTIDAGKYYGVLPYPILKVHLGNESFFFTSAAYSLMNIAEFASDTYASVRYTHYFEGFLLNRIPLIRKLKWRALAHSSALWGNLSQENQALVAAPEPGINGYIMPRSLGSMPYVEVGYGIENIFKFFRVDAFHRLTYLENTGARKFGVKVSMMFAL